MKRIAIIAIVMLAVMLAGCTKKLNSPEKTQEPPSPFTLVYSDKNHT